jgi:hypothetical protein
MKLLSFVWIRDEASLQPDDCFQKIITDAGDGSLGSSDWKVV